MRSVTVLALGLTLGACGDNLGALPDAGLDTGSCERTTPAVLPTVGMFRDPLAIPLPDNCVVGGLTNLPGRWFVGDPDDGFDYEYPAYRTTCADGLTRIADRPFNVAGGTVSQEVWDDGTRFYHRDRFVFGAGSDAYEYVNASVSCLLPDGTLAVTKVHFDPDRGPSSQSLTGTRFAIRDSPADGLERVGELGTHADGSPLRAYNLIVDDHLAYVCGPGGIDTIDVSNPAAPVTLATFPGQYNDVKIAHGNGKTIAYGSPIDGNTGTLVLDVTDPRAPVALAKISEYSHSIQIAADATGAPRLYLANYTNTIPIYDITDPATPRRLGAARVPGTSTSGIHDLTVDGTRLYANNTTFGLSAIDIATGIGTPTVLGHTASSYSHASWVTTIAGRPIILHGDEGWTQTAAGAAYLRIFDGDVASPTYLADIGRYQTRREVGIHNFLTVGNLAYIAYYHDGARVVDISDPTAPREVAHYNTWDFDGGYGETFEGAIGIRVANDLVWIADYNRGLIVLRATRPL